MYSQYILKFFILQVRNWDRLREIINVCHMELRSWIVIWIITNC